MGEAGFNRYLSGNFAPVTEERTEFELNVTGEIPECLDGRYLRIGPNPIVAPDPARYHWFTGDGMVHGIKLGGGRAEWYRNRWVRAGAVPAALGEVDPGGPGTPGADFAANTNVIGLAGRTFALVEAGAKPVELGDDLETIGRCDFGGALMYGFTAHPKIDPVTGELHAADYFWAHPNVIEYAVIDNGGQVTHIEEIPVPGKPMVHDLSITENYAVFYDLCVTFDLDSAAQGSALPYVWDPDYGCRVGVLERDRASGSPPKWFEVNPCYVFHAMNAFESTAPNGDELVVLDVVRHDRVFQTNRLAPDESLPTLWRWELNMVTGKATETQLGDGVLEFPRVDDRLTGRPYRYGYSLGVPSADLNRGVSFDGAVISRHDMLNGTTESHELGTRMAGGEATFIPSSVDADEDDGYLMLFAYDMDTDRSELRILAAQDISGEPVARVHLPVRVPFGFHGNWVPS
ncbi:MAG: carotenoid oxygenase family protein [Microthrixaceae bacterium]|nr:carotenoid oxygenase family protein [Microthrixaceae bacterium]